MSTTNVGTIDTSGELTDYYNNVEIEKLNAACAPYGKGTGATGARSIKVEDVDRVTGFIKEDYKKGTIEEYGNKVIYRLEEDRDTLTATVEGKPEIKTSIKISESTSFNFNTWIDGEEVEPGKDYVVEKVTYYDYDGNTYLDTSSKAYQMLFEDTNEDKHYILASYYSSAHEDYADIGLFSVYDGALGNYCFLWYSNDTMYGRWGDQSTRAVVSLKSDVKLTETSPNSGIWNIEA